MSLRGQAASGYAMAALLVAMAVMAVLMSVALPVWRHEAQREKEEELIWRGQQYIRAIRLFQRRTQTFPTSIDMLVQGRYLRKKYKDPITNEDFVPIPAAGAIPGQGGQPAGGRAGMPSPGGRSGTPAGGFGSGSGLSSGSTSGFGAGSSSGFGSGSAGSSSGFSAGTVPGGMIGVLSKSKDESIRLYQGRNHYNEWTFIFVNQQPGGPGGQGRPGGPGGRGTPGPPGSGGRGTPTPFGTGSGTFGGPGRGIGPGGRGLPAPGAGGMGRGRINQ
jgi:type II secretory pathway pseudopilin PulG